MRWAPCEPPVNVAATKLAVIPPGHPELGGQLLVVLFGNEKPMTTPAGPRIDRVADAIAFLPALLATHLDP